MAEVDGADELYGGLDDYCNVQFDDFDDHFMQITYEYIVFVDYICERN